MPGELTTGFPLVLPLALAAMGVATLGLCLVVGRLKSRLRLERTSRQAAENRLAASEYRLRQIIANEPECVKVQAPSGCILEMNPAGLQLLDADSADEVIGSSVYRFICPEYHDAYANTTKRVLAGERVKCEFQIVSLKGRVRWLETHAAPLKDASGMTTALLGITRDISDLKHYEHELRLHYSELSVASRLNTMGQLATALAHQINQPLAAIANYSRGCLFRLQHKAEDRELIWAIEQVCTQAERAGEIIASIRRLISRGDPARQPLQLSSVLQSAIRIVAPEAQVRGVKLNTNGVRESAPVMGEAIQIEQVILNILRNAIEAMETFDNANEKTIAISTSDGAGDNVEVNFSDTGTIVDTINADRMFEPFYTTKPRGMGMGLPISRSIIEAHGGQLGVRSNAPGPGLTFTISLPVTHQDAAP